VGEAMKRMKEEKPRREMARNRRMLILGVIGVVALLAVFIVLSITRQRIAYAEAHDMVSEIAATKGAMWDFLNNAPESLDFTDDEQKRVDEFEATLTKTENYIESLSASSAMKNAEVAQAYEGVKAEYPKIQQLAKVWGDVKLLLDLTDENIAKLKESSSERLKVLGEELSEYRAEMANFHEKYDGRAKTEGLIEEYGKMYNIGAELEKEYAEISLSDILGMSSDDILRFYATIEELNNKLSEKI
jgi:hypothetical protein